MNKKTIVIAVAVVAVLLVGGFVLMMVRSGSGAPAGPRYSADQTLPKIPADQIGFTTKMVDTHHVRIMIAKTDGIKSFNYDVIYDAFARDENNQPTNQKVNRDVSAPDDIMVTSGSAYQSDPILLGSCSTGGKCVFDIGTTKVTTDLKITKTDGKQYQSEYILNIGQ